MDSDTFENVRQRTIAIYGLPRYATIASVIRYLDRTVLKDLDIMNNRIVKGIMLERDGELSRAYINLSSRMFWTYAEERADKLANGVFAFSTCADNGIDRLSLRLQTPPECNWTLSYDVEKTKGIVKVFEIDDNPSSIYDGFSFILGLLRMSNVQMRSSGSEIMADVSSICLRRSSIMISVLDGQVSRSIERDYERVLGNQLRRSRLIPFLEFRLTPLAEIKDIVTERKEHLEKLSRVSFAAVDVERRVAITQIDDAQESLTVEAKFYQIDTSEDQFVLHGGRFSPLSPDYDMTEMQEDYSSDSTETYSVINGPLSENEYSAEGDNDRFPTLHL